MLRHKFKRIAAALAVLLITVSFTLSYVPTQSLAEQSGYDQSNYKNLTEDERNQLFEHARLGAIIGSLTEQNLHAQFPDADIQLFQNEPDIVAALIGGKIDYGFVSEFYANRFMEEESGYEYVTPWYISFDDRFITQYDNAELRDKMDEIITRYKEDGTLDAITKKWEQDRNYTMDDVPVNENGQVLRVVSTGCDEPYTFVSNGQLMGSAVELIERIAYELGMRCEFQSSGLIAQIAAVGSGKADVGMQLVPTAEREKQVNFTQTYCTLNYGALTKKAGATSAGFFETLSKNLQSTFVAENRYQLVLEGLGVTVAIAACSFVLGSILAAGLCAMQRSRLAPVRGLARVYSKLACGIPVLVWLMIFYYILLADIDIPAIAVGIICFGLQMAAPIAETFGVGLDAVDKGQTEAGLAMGFSKLEVFRRVVLPQAAARVWSLYTGQLTALIKETSVVGYIAIQDLTKVSDIIRSRTFQAFFPLIATAVIYFLIIALCSFALGRVALLLDPKRRSQKKILGGIEARKHAA